MTLLSERYARRLLAVAAAVCAAVLAVLSLAPPTRDGWWGPVFVEPNAVANGQLILVMIWSALGLARRYVRWSAAAAALWLTSRPLRAESYQYELWRLYLGWEILPHALISLMAFGLLRQCGLTISLPNRDTVPSAAPSQYNLRTMFVWVLSVAVLAFAWQQLIGLGRGINWPPTFGAREITIEGASRTLSLALTDLVAVWAVLRRSPLRWWQLWLLPIAIVAQTITWRLADQFVLGRSQVLLKDVVYVCGYDAFYLTPVIGVLLLARAAGYRLTRNAGPAT